MRFEIYEGKNGKWYWRLRSNCKIIADGGQGYSTCQNARRATLNLRKHIRTREVPIETVEK